MLYYIKQRNRDLMNAVRREVKASDGTESLDAILKRAVESPAPHFYVSYDTALKCLRRVRKSRRATISPLRHDQWNDLYTLVEQAMEQQGLSFTQAVTHVLSDAPAPQFYIALSTARKIYHEQVRMRFPLVPVDVTASQFLTAI